MTDATEKHCGRRNCEEISVSVGSSFQVHSEILKLCTGGDTVRAMAIEGVNCGF